VGERGTHCGLHRRCERSQTKGRKFVSVLFDFTDVRLVCPCLSSIVIFYLGNLVGPIRGVFLGAKGVGTGGKRFITKGGGVSY